MNPKSPSDSVGETDKNLQIINKNLEGIIRSLLLSLVRIRAAQDPGRLTPSLLDQLMELPADGLLDKANTAKLDAIIRQSGVMLDTQL